MFQHEIHFFRINLLCCYDKVSFILTVLIINDNHELAFFEVLDCLLHCIQL